MALNFEDIYQTDVVEQLINDSALNFKKNGSDYLSEGTCPSCKKPTLYISRHKPYVLACNRLNNCAYTEKTRDRYPELFENLSKKYPATPDNPNATADAYLSRQRGFDISKLAGLYQQKRVQTKSGTWGDAVQFPLCGGSWSRFIDAEAVADNDGKKCKISYQSGYRESGWTFPDIRYEDGGRVFIVEGIFHAIALRLAGYEAIASISCQNFPWNHIRAHSGRGILWVIAFDNDNAGRPAARKYYDQLREIKEQAVVALGEPGIDWDDVHRAGKLDAAYIEESIYRGRLFTASSREKKAWLIYQHDKQPFFLFEFNSRLYSATVDVAALTSQDNDDDNHESDADNFRQAVTITQEANCYPVFEYIQRDVFSQEQQYFFSFRFPDKTQSCTVALAPGSIADSRAFSKSLLERTPGGSFEGSDKILRRLRGQWLANVQTVNTLPYIGYDEETGVYCYPAFGYQHGRRVEINRHGFLGFGRAGIKTGLNGFNMTRAAGEFKTDWFEYFYSVYQLNGLAALAWWTGSLFAQQIKKRQSSWLFLEITGQAGSGKSSLLRFLWRLVGQANREGIKPNSDGASAIGLKRAFSQVSNLPVVLIESDRETINSQGRLVVQQYAWDNLKDLFDYNATLRTVGVKSASADTAELIFRGTLCISQNSSVEASEAILTRIAHLHFTRDHHTPALKQTADHLNRLEADFLAGYLDHALTNEGRWLETYFSAFKRYEKQLQGVSQIQHQRIVLCHAQLLAAAEATRLLFSGWDSSLQNELSQHLTRRALDRQSRVNHEPALLGKFWEVYHYLNEKHLHISDADGERDEISTERLNHSPNPREEIAINMPHLIQTARQHGLTIDEDVTKLFPKSTTYLFRENKKLRSRLEKRPLNCWVFDKRQER